MGIMGVQPRQDATWPAGQPCTPARAAAWSRDSGQSPAGSPKRTAGRPLRERDPFVEKQRAAAVGGSNGGVASERVVVCARIHPVRAHIRVAVV